MNVFINPLRNTAAFVRDEEGAQVIEYALIIALVSIALALVLRTLVTGTGNSFSSFITRVSNCFSSAGTCS